MSFDPEPDLESGDPQLAAVFDAISSSAILEVHGARPLNRCLGGGGQGLVFLSERRGVAEFSLPVALKLFSPRPYADRSAYELEMQRIASVACEVARIQHDNLVDVHDVVRFDGIHAMEMEWVDGYDLRALLTPAALQYVREHVTQRRWEKLNAMVITEGSSQPRVKPALALAIIRECLRGLSALHRDRIVHNDLKPSNIMLKRSGNVKLIDFGGAFSLDHVPDKNPCTPHYAAPEVLRGEIPTPQSDLASLGYVLLEMLSGVNIFAGLKYSNLLKSKQGILKQIPKLLPTEEFAFTDLLIPFLRRLIDPKPENRFTTAEEADEANDGAEAFERELIKGDMSGQYESAIREWMHQVDIGLIASDINDDLATTGQFRATDLSGVVTGDYLSDDAAASA